MIVIGTAGHIDHGKSSIVKRLTGTDPDRLPEEKLRGMTIDLGFAFYQTPKNETIAFVDVPGHERFVKNMIAGAGGFDAVMLVVAADDGWMLQTEEHFQIVRLLCVRSGFIVINKCDLVDEAALRYLHKEIHRKVKGSFLGEAPILSISASTGAGFEVLTNYLNGLTEKLSERKDIGKARLYIDRVFVKQGIGYVATGTLKDGSFTVGQTVNVWPSLEKGKIKALHSNNLQVMSAAPSQRTAISLTGTGKDHLIRGGVITALDNLEHFNRNQVLVLNIELLKNSSFTLENKRRALLLVGTTETEGEIRLFGKTQIAPGESGIVFFRPDKPVLTFIGDRFILRLPTPMATLGGGVVLDLLSSVPRKRDFHNLEYLRQRNIENLNLLIVSELHKLIIAQETKVLEFSCIAGSEIAAAIKHLIDNGRCGKLGDHVFATETMVNVSEKVSNYVRTRIEKKGGLKGVSLAEIIDALPLERETAEVVVNFLLKCNKLQMTDDLFKPFEIKSKLPPAIQSACNDILAALKKEPFTPPTLESLVSKEKNRKEAIGHLLKTNEIHKCGSDFIFLHSTWIEIESFIKRALEKKNELTVGTLRDNFNISRKYAVPILEETDRIKLTKRQGDIRVKGEKFECR